MTTIRQVGGGLRMPSRLQQLKKVKKDLPLILGNQAKNFFLDGFKRGGFTDNRFKRWQPRRKQISRTRTSPTETEPSHLTKSSDLKRSVKVRQKTFRRTKVGTSGVRYANTHNLGIKGRIPQREFIGNSKKLEDAMNKTIRRKIDKVFKR